MCDRHCGIFGHSLDTCTGCHDIKQENLAKYRARFLDVAGIDSYINPLISKHSDTVTTNVPPSFLVFLLFAWQIRALLGGGRGSPKKATNRGLVLLQWS